VKIDRTPAELRDRSIKYILTFFHMSSVSPNFICTMQCHKATDESNVLETKQNKQAKRKLPTLA